MWDGALFLAQLRVQIKLQVYKTRRVNPDLYQVFAIALVSRIIQRHFM